MVTWTATRRTRRRRQALGGAAARVSCRVGSDWREGLKASGGVFATGQPAGLAGVTRHGMDDVILRGRERESSDGGMVWISSFRETWRERVTEEWMTSF